MSYKEPHLIMIAEDDDDDRLLFEEGIRQCDYNVQCRFLQDGAEVIAYLREESNPRPVLIFVNLRMPQMGALDLIPELKADPRTDVIPVLVFTGSHAEDEVRRVYAESGKAYVVKPTTLKEWVETLNQIFRYWFQTVRLPHLP
jgi:two-component system response regulator